MQIKAGKVGGRNGKPETASKNRTIKEKQAKKKENERKQNLNVVIICK